MSGSEYTLLQVQEVECAGYAALFIIDAPLGAVGVEVKMLGELLEEAVGIVALVGPAQVVVVVVVALNLGVHHRSQVASLLTLALPQSLHLLGGHTHGGSFLGSPIVGIKLLETFTYEGGYRLEDLAIHR